MLALIRTLGPVAAMLIGIAGGSALIGGGAWLWNEWIDNPHVRDLVRVEERAACTIRTMAAADAAEAAERTLQEQAGRAALDAYQRAAEARERLQIEVQDKLEQEIADNEALLAAQGRSCLLDPADVRWLRGERNAADPTAGGR